MCRQVRRACCRPVNEACTGDVRAFRCSRGSRFSRCRSRAICHSRRVSTVTNVERPLTVYKRYSLRTHRVLVRRYVILMSPSRRESKRFGARSQSIATSQ